MPRALWPGLFSVHLNISLIVFVAREVMMDSMSTLEAISKAYRQPVVALPIVMSMVGRGTPGAADRAVTN